MNEQGFDQILVKDGEQYRGQLLEEFICTSPGDAPVVAFLNHVFHEAVGVGASDVHFVHHPSGFRVRFRVNGALQDRYYLTPFAANQVDSKIRSRCMLDAADRLSPLDGSLTVLYEGRRVDLRVSFIPNLLGQSIVCRLLDQANAGRSLDSIWMPDTVRTALMHALHLEEGLILNVGPTGSGKTSTLYACLNYLNKPNIHICTAEDPVEYFLPGANQVPVVNPQRSFAKVLRSFLRQDFDIGLVGEIRDEETADITMKLSITGHLILSTLHTKSTLATISRLVDLGVKPYMIADALKLIIAQRLPKKLCPHCALPHEVTDEERRLIAKEEGARSVNLDERFYVANPEGCHQCSDDKGYSGRIPVIEALVGDQDILQAIEAQDRHKTKECALAQPQYKPLIATAMEMSRHKLVDFRSAMKINL